jgi:probable HAF family extracellular repeat protein
LKKQEESMKATNQTTLRKYCKFSFGMATLVLLSLGTAAAQTAYTVTDLGTLGGTFSVAVGLNHNTEIVGVSTLAGDTAFHGFLWQNSLLTDIGTLGGPDSTAAAINEADQIVGISETGGTDGNPILCFSATQSCGPFVWQNGAFTELPTLGGNNGGAVAINSHGLVGGAAEIASIDPNTGFRIVHSALWRRSVVVADLGTLGGFNSVVQAINEFGQTVGGSEVSEVPNPPVHAYLWESGIIRDLGTLGGLNNVGLGINDQSGDTETNRTLVVGLADLPGGTQTDAFLWEDGSMQDLGALGGTFSVAVALNNKIQVVGGANLAGDTIEHAFTWQDGVMTDLNDLVTGNSDLQLLEAEAVTAAGQIVGAALQNSTGQIHAFLLTPTNGTPRVTKGFTALPDTARSFLRNRRPRWMRPVIKLVRPN